MPGDKFLPEMCFRQPRFTYNHCGPFTKNKGRIQRFKETGNSKYIYWNKIHKACSQHDMAYGDFKDLPRKAASDKVLGDLLILLKNLNMWIWCTSYLKK